MWVHWAMKSFCDRFAISITMPRVSGIATIATSASSGEITNMMISTPITVSREISSWLSVC